MVLKVWKLQLRQIWKFVISPHTIELALETWNVSYWNIKEGFFFFGSKIEFLHAFKNRTILKFKQLDFLTLELVFLMGSYCIINEFGETQKVRLRYSQIKMWMWKNVEKLELQSLMVAMASFLLPSFSFPSWAPRTSLELLSSVELF